MGRKHCLITRLQYLDGLLSFQVRNDPYLLRKLKDIVVHYLPLFSTVSPWHIQYAVLCMALHMSLCLLPPGERSFFFFRNILPYHVPHGGSWLRFSQFLVFCSSLFEASSAECSFIFADAECHLQHWTASSPGEQLVPVHRNVLVRSPN